MNKNIYKVKGDWLIKFLANGQEQGIRISSIQFYRIGEKKEEVKYSRYEDGVFKPYKDYTKKSYIVRVYGLAGQFITFEFQTLERAQDLVNLILGGKQNG